MLFVVCWLAFVVWCLFVVDSGVLFLIVNVRCGLSEVRCLLFVVCCVVLVDGFASGALLVVRCLVSVG